MYIETHDHNLARQYEQRLPKREGRGSSGRAPRAMTDSLMNIDLRAIRTGSYIPGDGSVPKEFEGWPNFIGTGR